jgi:hypothetical protein
MRIKCATVFSAGYFQQQQHMQREGMVADFVILPMECKNIFMGPDYGSNIKIF